MTQRTLPITKERIEAKVLRIPEAGCWIWTGSTMVRGYGEIISENKKHYAHRASYEAFVGPIPKGFYVCHSCDTPACVNPYHLFAGTQKNNLVDMVKKGRSTRGERNSQAKLTEEQVKFVRTSTQSCNSLAKQLNVSCSTLSAIRRNESWHHV